MQIPGVDWVTAAFIIAEIGTDMDVFATARRLAAWAGVAPGNYESAGKQKGAGTRRGNVFLKSALFAAASAAVRTKGSYYRDKYNHLRARCGPMRAIMAKLGVQVSEVGVRKHGAEFVAQKHIRVAAPERVARDAGSVIRHGRERLRRERHGRPPDGKPTQRCRQPKRCRLRQQINRAHGAHHHSEEVRH